jgi:hypothetical protein
MRYDTRTGRNQGWRGAPPWLKEKNGWLLPWGEVVTNPLKAQRLTEELNEKQVAA